MRSLTETDRRVVALIADGLDTEDIAEELFVSRYSVRDRIRKIRGIVGGDRMTDLPRLVEEYDQGVGSTV